MSQHPSLGTPDYMENLIMVFTICCHARFYHDDNEASNGFEEKAVWGGFLGRIDAIAEYIRVDIIT